MQILRRFFLWRWLVTLAGIVRFGARIHPTAVLLGKFGLYKIDRGAKLGARLAASVSGNGCIHFGERVWIAADVEINTSTAVSIGPQTTVQRHCTLNGTVEIGEQCLLAPNVFISSGTHIFQAWPELTIREQEARYRSMSPGERPPGYDDKPVRIGRDCWLGANAVILPGVSLGEACVVGANSVVTKSFPRGSVIAGIPAKVISNRFPDLNGNL